MSRKPTAKEQILRFFDANPHEELSICDMAAKTGRTKRTIRDTVTDLRKEGRIMRVILYRRPE